jgi:hypothetical protein
VCHGKESQKPKGRSQKRGTTRAPSHIMAAEEKLKRKAYEKRLQKLHGELVGRR